MSEVMARPLYHPETDKIELASVLDALSDPLRLQIVAQLAEAGKLTMADVRELEKTIRNLDQQHKTERKRDQ